MTTEDFSEFIELLKSARTLATRHKGSIAAIEIDVNAYNALLAGAAATDVLGVAAGQEYLNLEPYQRAIRDKRILGVTLKVVPDLLR